MLEVNGRSGYEGNIEGNEQIIIDSTPRSIEFIRNQNSRNNDNANNYSNENVSNVEYCEQIGLYGRLGNTSTSSSRRSSNSVTQHQVQIHHSPNISLQGSTSEMT